MAHLLDSWVEPSLWFLADWSLRWAVLIGGMALWMIVLRPRRSATRYLTCVLVLGAGLLLPLLPRWVVLPIAALDPVATGGSPVAFGPATGEPPVGTGKGHPGSPEDNRPVRSQVERVPAIPVVDHRPVSETRPDPDPPEASEPLGARRLVVLALAGAWLAGVLVLLLRWAGGFFFLARLRRTAVVVRGNSAALFEACRQQLGLRRRVILASHPEVASPVTLGLFRPMILVPPHWIDLPEAAQRGGLLHELAHLLRRDDWLALVLEVVRVGFFFHPLLLWLLGRIELERELLCDERAVAAGTPPQDYARLLLEFSRRPGRLLSPLTGAAYPLRLGKRRTIKIRINHLLEENMDRWLSPLPRTRAVALGVVVLSLAVCLGSFGAKARESAALAPLDKPPAAGGDEPAPAPKGPFRISSLDVLKIRALNTLPAVPINGFYLVEPGGKVELGPTYGKVAVAGLTLEEASTAIEKHLGKTIKDVKASVTLAGYVTHWRNGPKPKDSFVIKPYDVVKVLVLNTLPGQPIEGAHLVDPDGKIDLGPSYGKVAVAGLSLDDTAGAVEKHLRKTMKTNGVSVTLGGWERDWHNLEEQGPRRTETAPAAAPGKEALLYGGKTFDQWRTELMTELKPEVRIDGIKALAAFGANGYGTEAVAAILEVVKGYDVASGDRDDQRVTQAARGAVAKIGSAALPLLIRGLKEENRNIRRFVVFAVQDLGPDAHGAFPALLEASKDKDVYVRDMALVAASNIDPKNKALVRVLADHLKDEKSSIRSRAAQLLQLIGPEARAAVPALIAACKDENTVIQRSAIRALSTIGPAAKEAVPTVAEALQSGDRDTRYAAIEYFSALGPEARGAVPALIVMLKDRPHRLDVVQALGAIGPDAKAAVGPLKELLPRARTAGPPDLYRVVEWALREIQKTEK